MPATSPAPPHTTRSATLTAEYCVGPPAPRSRSWTTPARTRHRPEEIIYGNLERELPASVTATTGVTAEGESTVLGRHDSVHLTEGTVRSVENRSDRPATLLVAIAL